MNPYSLLDHFVNSWYFVVIVLGVILIIVTRKSLSKLIDNIKINFIKKNLNVSANQDQQVAGKKTQEYKKVQGLFKELNVKSFKEFSLLLEQNRKGIEDSKAAQNNLFQLWKYYMFSFFNLFLVVRSKIALVWLYNNPNSTKDMFALNINIPAELVNKELEREAVFNALISHSLINKDDRDLYKVSNVGCDFLKFIGLIT